MPRLVLAKSLIMSDTGDVWVRHDLEVDKVEYVGAYW